MAITSTFPLSFFDSVHNPIVDLNGYYSFEEFAKIMCDFSTDSYKSKDAFPLFSSTTFTNGKRSKKNATSSGLIVLEFDDGRTIDELVAVVKQLGTACLIYSTASPQQYHHEFKVCIPLDSPVGYDDHHASWKAINQILASDESSSTKVGCERVFPVPGSFPGSTTLVFKGNGDVFSAQDWIEVADQRLVPALESKSFRDS